MPQHTHVANLTNNSVTGTLSTGGWFEAGRGTASGVFKKESSNSGYEGRGGGDQSKVITFAHSHTHNLTVDKIGSSQKHNIMQPYLSVYCWHRVS